MMHHMIKNKSHERQYIMLKKFKNRQIIVIDSIDSPYFEQGILILKDGTVKEDDKIVNEANRIVSSYTKKFESGFSSDKKGKKFKISILCVALLTLGIFFKLIL